MINVFQSWLCSVSFVHITIYWLILAIVDFIWINRIALKNKYEEHTLFMNFWWPFGTLAPCFWVLNLTAPMVIDIIVSAMSGIFFGIARPYIYRLQRNK